MSLATKTEPCRVCSSGTNFLFTNQVIDQPVAYLECSNCGYVQTENPHWLAKAYDQPIGDADTGILLRNAANVSRVVAALVSLGKLRGRVLDFGGGFGILVRMLRDIGVEANWRDMYCQNLLARGFEAEHQTYDLTTAFELFEHLVNPLQDLQGMLDIAPAVLVSTELAPEIGALKPDWWYLVPEYGQHIGFFRPSTLAWMAQKLGCYYATDFQSVHFFARDRSAVQRWSMIRRLTPIATRIARVALRSRTMDDFEIMRKRMKAARSGQAGGDRG